MQQWHAKRCVQLAAILQPSTKWCLAATTIEAKEDTREFSHQQRQTQRRVPRM